MTTTPTESAAAREARRALSERKAQEAVVSLERLVQFWEGAAGSFEPHEELWGELLRSQALDLGLVEVHAALPKLSRPMALSELEGTMDALRRRGVDMAHAHFLCEQKGEPDLYLSVPRAFPELNIMATPDPKRVGLLR